MIEHKNYLNNIKKDMEKLLLEYELLKLSIFEYIPKSEYKEELENKYIENTMEIELLINRVNKSQTLEELKNIINKFSYVIKDAKIYVEMVNNVRNRTSTN